MTEKKPSDLQYWILSRMAFRGWAISATPCTVALFDGQTWRRSLKGMMFHGLKRSGWIEVDPEGVKPVADLPPGSASDWPGRGRVVRRGPADFGQTGRSQRVTGDEGNSNIQVEITDASEFHCFRLLLNPKGHEAFCLAAMVPAAPCSCRAEGEGVRIEIMLHARSLVDLIHKLSTALCEWQTQTTAYLIKRLSQEVGPR
jgi:hypothetical protein